MFQKLLMAGCGVLALALGVLGAACGALAYELARPAREGAPAVEFRVEKGKSLSSVAQELEKQGLLRSAWSFRLLHRLALEKAPIQAGVFSVSAAKSPAELFWSLRFGPPVLRPYTVPEGLTMVEIAEILETASKSGIQKQPALALMRDPKFARSLGVEQATLEGYLLPETYFFPDDTPPEKILEAMVEAHFKALPSNYPEREAELGLTHHQLVTLASLVQSETPLDEERPQVAEVFYERHRSGMRLQCDPTTVYGVEGFKPPITRKDLERQQPYNTYIITGLPPGPISNPGRPSLLAALSPTKMGYLYFVARADGTRGHQFSRSLEEHNRAVQIYRQRIEAQRAGAP